MGLNNVGWVRGAWNAVPKIRQCFVRIVVVIAPESQCISSSSEPSGLFDPFHRDRGQPPPPLTRAEDTTVEVDGVLLTWTGLCQVVGHEETAGGVSDGVSRLLGVIVLEIQLAHFQVFSIAAVPKDVI